MLSYCVFGYIWDIMGFADILEKGQKKHRVVVISARGLSKKNLRTPQKYTNTRTLEKPTIRSDSLISTENQKNRPSVIVAEQ